MKECIDACRREFLKTSLFGGLATAAAGHLASSAVAAESKPAGPGSHVALTTGDDRAENVFSGLQAFREEIAKSIGKRRVVIKPNNVAIDIQLASTHADCLKGVLEFLKSIGKLNDAVIAESAGTGPTTEAFANFGYARLAAQYGVKLVDFDQQTSKTIHVFDQTDMRPHAVRMSPLLLDRGNFIISVAKLKTHDLVVATLSLKNIILGAPVKDQGFRWGKGLTPGKITQKPLVHGSGIHGINYNLFALAERLHPDLAVIDGYDGMEGNGPVGGTAVDHRICLVSPDWLAADRVGVELMGIDFSKIGYLNYCAQAKMGQTDLKRIEILGPPLARHVRQYKLSSNIEQQLAWQMPPEKA